LSASLKLQFAGAPALGYLDLLSLLRWRREFGSAQGLGGTLRILDARSLPAPGSAGALESAARERPEAAVYPLEDDAAEPARRWSAPPASTWHSYRALAGAGPKGSVELASHPAAARAVYLPEGPGAPPPVAARGFRVLGVRGVFGAREEILGEIPAGCRRLLDVGCGSGQTAAEARRRRPGLFAAGIERDPALADRARAELDEVLEGDAVEALRALSGRGDRFDAVVFADVLEHLADPFPALEEAARLLRSGGRIVASVPNAAAFPLVEDLLAGRHDLLGAGIEDAGHLRWFTKRSLAQALEECGFRTTAIRGVPVPEDGTAFFEIMTRTGLPFSAEDLSALQWIAVAHRP
jgi:SAM-dependent methyltransferase